MSALIKNRLAPAFGLLKIAGPDAKKFLQGQLTCHLEEVSENHSRLGAHCNPQGRVLFIFRILYYSQAYFLVLPETMLNLAQLALAKYARFFKLEITQVNAAADAELQALATQEWAFFDPNLGHAQIHPATSGLFLPHELRLHELDGLSWNKGCYTGQEIIARMHYRGKAKNQLFKAKIGSSQPPQAAADLYYLDKNGAYQPVAQVVDFAEQGYNTYIILLITQELYLSSPLKLDPQSSEQWEWLPHG